MTELSADKLAQFISNITFEKLPIPALEQIRWRLLDALGTILGDDTNVIGLASGSDRPTRAKEVNTATGSRPSLQPAQLALTMADLLGAAPLHAWTTQAFARIDAVIIAAAWSTVDATGGNGRLLIEALAAGYATSAVLAERVADDDMIGWHAGVSSGAIAAAAAAARAQGLSDIATLNALGFAAGQAARLAENGQNAAHADPLASVQDRAGPPGAGRAAMDGVLSARMAALGATCPAELINPLRQRMDAASTQAEPWSLMIGQQSAPTADQAMRSFRQRLSASIEADRVEAIIKLIGQLEHTEMRALRSCILP